MSNLRRTQDQSINKYTNAQIDVQHLYGTYVKTRNTKMLDSKKSSSWSIEDHSKNSKVIQTNFTQHKRNHPVNQSRSNSPKTTYSENT